MKNYDNHLFRVSSLPHIMAGLKSVDDLYYEQNQKVIDLSAKVDKYRNDYNNIVNKETKTAQKKLESLNKASKKLDFEIAIRNAYRSQIGKVFISEGCKTHLIDVFVASEFNRPTRDIKSKYLDKGIFQEEAGITLVSVLKNKLYEKNLERRDDGFIMGECDIVDNKPILDIKCSWDLWTFFRNIKYLENPDQNPYYGNMQGYMKLWEKETSKVCYTLVDTPKKLIEAEKKKLLYDFIGTEEMYEEACVEIEKNLTFSDIDPERKLIEIKIDRDEEFIEKIPKVVIACREYLNSIKYKYYEVD